MNLVERMAEVSVELKKPRKKRKPVSEESRQKMRESALRRFQDPVQRAEHQKRQKALWQREDFRAKRAAMQKPRSAESRQKSRESALRQIKNSPEREILREVMKDVWRQVKARMKELS